MSPAGDTISERREKRPPEDRKRYFGIEHFIGRTPLVRLRRRSYGAAMWSWFKRGNLETKDGDSLAEGISQTRVTKNLEGLAVDEAYRIADQTALTVVHHLLKSGQPRTILATRLYEH
ncbi:MAG: hypothetical protein KGJ60_09375 [Verrucomicrobiota bacterium]|nr:hypothetical protein [Verrucomicrobiota bacterium]